MKRIITCSDGTWNKPNSMYRNQPVRTNVQKIFEAIKNRDPENDICQVKFYDEGVGSQGNTWIRLLNGATGKGIDDNILAAYKFILWNYEPGDEIYVFGFSRGAYTARSLAGLIRKCGILKNNDLNQIKQAYDIYRNKKDPDFAPDGSKTKVFRDKYAYTFDKDSYRIKFVGVWDTVGALGIPLAWFQWYNKKKYNFYDTTLSSMIEHAYHALAIDEVRGTFMPTLWQTSGKLGQADNKATQIMEQVWFAGVHSNIGGGYPDAGLSDIALQWMVDKACALKLSFDKNCLNATPSYKGELYNSDGFPFNLSPKFIRKVNETAFANETVHPSVWERVHDIQGYKPNNLEGKQ